MPIANLNMGVSGHFRLRTKKRDGTVTKDTGEFPNIITLGGFARLNSTASAHLESDGSFSGEGLSRCQVGSDSTTPTISDDTIGTKIAEVIGHASTTQNVRVFDSGTPENSYVERTIEYEFGEGVAAGNVAEITIGSPSGTDIGGFNLFNRALVLDGMGNPTTITVLADEFLSIIYTFRIYPFVGGATNQTFDATIEGSTVSTTIKIVPKNFNSFTITSAPFGFIATNNEPFAATDTTLSDDITASPAIGTQLTSFSTHSYDYTPSTAVGILTNSFTPSEGNELGAPISVYTFSSFLNNAHFAVLMDPAIDKDNTKSFDIAIQLTWSNYSAP